MLSPNDFDIWLKYTCECGNQHCLTQEEVKGPFVIVCGVCNKREHIKPIKSIKVKIDFCKIPSGKIAKTGVTPAVSQDAWKTLKVLGYSLEAIEKTQQEIKAKDKKTLIREFLKRQK